MEDKKDYITRIYKEARLRGLCNTQGEFAQLLGMNQSTISNALKGDEKYLTDNFIRRVKAWAGQMLTERGNETTMQAPAPDIVIPAATATLYNNMSETIRLQAEIIARLQVGIATSVPAGVYAPKNYRTDGK